MSYILDALKKSDQERQQNNGPSLQTVQRPHLLNKQGRSRHLVLLVLLCLMLVAGGWYLKDITGLTVPKPLAQEAVQSPVVAPVATPKPVIVPPVELNQQLVEFSQLPDPVQQAIPALTFSFHVFSDNPERRTIIINKRRVREGNEVSAGLVLEEITEQGVILQWQGQHRFTIDVVENW